MSIDVGPPRSESYVDSCKHRFLGGSEWDTGVFLTIPVYIKPNGADDDLAAFIDGLGSHVKIIAH